MERPYNNVLLSRALHDQCHLRCFAITGEFEEMGSVEDDSEGFARKQGGRWSVSCQRVVGDCKPTHGGITRC